MLLILGYRADRVASVIERLSSRGRACSWTDHALDPPTLFDRAFRAKATGLIVLEGEERNDDVLRAALSAMEAPGMALLVVVTDRIDDDRALVDLRRRGAPWIVLRAGRIVSLADADALRDRRVAVDRRVVAATRDAVSADAVAEAIVRVLDDDACVGRAIPVERTEDGAVVDALRRAGARPEVVSTWRARVEELFGRSVARVDGNGRAYVHPPPDSLREAS